MIQNIKMGCLILITGIALAAAVFFSGKWMYHVFTDAAAETVEQTEPTTVETTLPAEPETTAAAAEETEETEQTVPEESEPVETMAAAVTIDTVPRYSQADYSHIRYGSGTVATSGSNVVALAMVATYMTDHVYTPDQIADWMVQITGGSYKRLEDVSDLLQLSWYRAENINVALSAVQEGKVAIFLMGSSSLFPGGGHFIVVTGINEEGKYWVIDPDPQNYTAWNLADSLENGFTSGKLIAGFEGAWVYDKSEMPDEPFLYEPEPAPEESRYPDLELTEAEVELMAQLISMEAQSEPFEGQQAVAEVILNRLVSGAFQSSIRSIIYADDQFTAVQNLYLAEPVDTQYKAIERALNGPYVLPIDVVFYATYPVNQNVWGTIGSHVFCYRYEN